MSYSRQKCLQNRNNCQALAPVSLQTSGPLISSFFYSRSVGAATEAASTSDSAVDRRLTKLGECSNEPGASGSRMDFPSIPDLSQRSESENSDDDEKVDDYGDAGNGSMGGTSDHEMTENGQRDRTSDQDCREKESRDEMSDLDDTAENSASNGMHIDVGSDDVGRETMDVLKKKRKTKRKLEVNIEL